MFVMADFHKNVIIGEKIEPVLDNVVPFLIGDAIFRRVLVENAFDGYVKEMADVLFTNYGITTKFVQCLKNGNADFPDDILEIIWVIIRAEVSAIGGDHD